MTLDEALRVADNDRPMLWSDIAPLRESVTVLAAEVRRLQAATCKDCSLSHMAERIAQLQAEVTALRLYAPAKRAGKMSAPVQIAQTNFAYWMNETDEEFRAWGNVHIAVVV